MNGKPHNERSSSRQNISATGCNQSKFNNQKPILPYGIVIQHGHGRYLPHQTNSGPLQYPPAKFFCEICEAKMTGYKNMEQHKNGKRHQAMLRLHKESQKQKTINGQETLVQSPKAVSKSDKNRCHVDNVSSVATIDKGYLHKNTKNSEVLDQKSERVTKENFASRGHRFKRKISGTSGGKYMKTNNGTRRFTESFNYAESKIHVPAEPTLGPVASYVVAPAPVGESSSEFKFKNVSASQMQVSEREAHRLIRNLAEQANDQTQSISMELHAPEGSSVNSQTKDVNSHDFASTEIAAPHGLVAPQEFTPAAAVESNFRHQIQHALHTETKPQGSEAIADNESQNPTDEPNKQLPSSVYVEFDAPADSSTTTQTAEGSPHEEEKTDVFASELEAAQLPKVTFCLKRGLRGDRGFPEVLAFCNKCKVHEVHRCCLDGPVIFVDDVNWFCEGFEEKVADTSSHEQYTPSGTRDNLSNDANQTRIELTIHIRRVKENKQQGENTASKTKMLLSDSHTPSPQCNNNCEEENKFKEECQSVPKDAAFASQEFVCFQNSQVATNVVEFDDQNDGHPTTDPIWRGTLSLNNKSVGTAATTIIGLLAHLSSLACSKVLEATRLVSEVLCVDLLQRNEVWPKSFINSGPTDLNIALYFFPEDERVERDYDKLVDDIIHKDLAMRAMVGNVELLVFPSTVLPPQHRRFQAKYYLWGIFRANPNSPETGNGVKDIGVKCEQALT